MNKLEEIPVALPVTVSAPPFEGDGTWIWIDNEGNDNFDKANDEFDKHRLDKYRNNNDNVVEENTKFSWLKTKINKIIPRHSKNIDKVFKVAKKTYKIVEKRPELALVVIGTGVGVVYVAGKLIANGALYMIIPKITVNINKNK